MPAPGETYQQAGPTSPKPYISYGLPFQEAASWHVTNTFDVSRVYVVVSATISKTKDWAGLRDALGSKLVGVRYGIKPHTPWNEVYELAADLQRVKPHVVITLGGGSITDGVKLARLFAANDVLTTEARLSFWEKAKPRFEKREDREDIASATNSCIFIPTSLSAGEWSQYGGATDDEGHKSLFQHKSMLADIVIYDPALTLGLPEKFWFSTGVRTIDHCVEGLSSTNKVDDEDAIRDELDKALRRLLPNLLITKTKNYRDLDARLQCQLATVILPRAITIGVAASHGIGHQLGPLGVGHGETSCILLPNVLKFNWKHGDDLARQRQDRLRGIFWSDPVLRALFQKRGLEEDKADAGDLLDAYLRELGMPRTLRGAGIKREQFDSLAESSLRDPCTTNGPVKIGKAEVLEILDMAWDD
ncbi:Dehydroquinate synthase-like protein [Cryphonectria parasitica EP155]|uniref:Dehydroquinate synthase-like protein n=1 Tax=Cryphonectria parasitica (strain ATCC 38755 / EP155) TaxID=660469 RepID=A0A9P5CTD0_CRYP1|nr:Dehydroquinate synthase-like protein [Cryphonectria parasitica EP155]KAF3769532.1 Dehydroquinate synthase-like protein [Cryphonectria parasitica EP155]